MGAKKDDGCNSQIAGFRDEMQVLENSEGIIFQGICREAFLLDGILQEIVNGFPVDILFNRGIWNFHFVPVHSHLGEEETLQRFASEGLVGGSATVVDDAVQGDCHVAGMDYDFNVVNAVAGTLINIGNNTQFVDDLVG